MTFRIRFIVVAIFNCLLMLGMLFAFSKLNIDLSERLIDLNFDKAGNMNALLIFLGGVLVAFVVNFIVLSSRKSEFSYEEMRGLMTAIKH